MHVFIVLALLVSEGGEGIYDDTEDNVQRDNVDYDVERAIMDQFKEVFLSIVVKVERFSCVSNSSSEANALVESRNIALEHGLAVVLSHDVTVE